MRKMDQTNSSRFITPLQYKIEVKNVVMSKAYKIKLLTHTYTYSYINTTRFIPEGVAEVSQIFLRETHVLPK
jgi:hypothetical protein